MFSRLIRCLISVLVAVCLVGVGAASASADADGSRAAKRSYTVAPGKVGKAKVGMSVRRALKTRQFRHNVRYSNEACSYTIELQPKGGWKRHYDAVTVKHRLFEMGILSKRLRTTNGSGIGTPLSALRKRYGARLSKPRAAGYGQQAVFVRAGEGKKTKWLGFLLSTEAYTHATPASGDRVTFMAVTRGKRPLLMRDGC